GRLGSQRREPAHQDRARGRGRPRRGSGGRPRMTRARIVGIGAYAPKRILTNAELEKMVETSDEWIVQRTGIRERFIVVGTTAGDMHFPTTANLVQHRLGCRNAGSVDVYAACSGSVYSLSIGAQ